MKRLKDILMTEEFGYEGSKNTLLKLSKESFNLKSSQKKNSILY